MGYLKRTLAISLTALLVLLCLSFAVSAILRIKVFALKESAEALPTIKEFEQMIGDDQKADLLKKQVDAIGEKMNRNCRYLTFFVGNEHLSRVKVAHANLSAAIYSSERADYGTAKDAFLEAIETLIYVIG